ncbi:MAG: 1-acyl-sn-glycerol-3-phosphate acyltransferase [Chlorobi bacterium]|nr:1-acyl-sn-glycerol-3-phosphate acyltransferase [Chlorobiota bacterium]
MIPNLFFVRSEGFENLPEQGPAIYVFNHNNTLESLLVPVFLMFHLGGRKVSFVIDWMYGKIPLLGWLMNLVDPLYVYHKRSRFRLIEKKRPPSLPEETVLRCCTRLLDGGSIGIFPEGRRNRHPGKLARAKPGIGHIILSSGVPVIPIGIDFPAGHRKGRIPAVGRMIVRAGAPLAFHDERRRYFRIEACGNSCRRSRESHVLAAETAHSLMLHLAGLCGKSYEEPHPASGSVFFNNKTSEEERPCPV